MKEELKSEEISRVQQRELLYKLMICQLLYDGHQGVAQLLAEAICQEGMSPSSDRLMNIFTLGLPHELEVKRPLNRLEQNLGLGLDLEYESEQQTSAPEPAQYMTAYVTSHKDQCHAAVFSPDGNLVATGSVDASIKILDVDRMLAKSDPESLEHNPDTIIGHPVIRTLYDHVDEVTCLEFHPRETLLVSGSRDANVKLFDYSRGSAKKAFRTMTDAEPITCLSIHPSGDYVAVGTEAPVVRIYDVSTGQCFVCPYPREHHKAGVTGVRYSPEGKLLASSSSDGDVKIWDGVSGRCVQTFSKSHDAQGVCSVVFSRNGKYVLSSGMDSVVRLWELSGGRCIVTYTGAGTMGKQEQSTHAIFNHTEDFVMFPDEATISLCAWDARSGQRKNLLALGHNGPVRHMAHSPVTSAFITCSDDFRARFWFRRNVH